MTASLDHDDLGSRIGVALAERAAPSVTRVPELAAIERGVSRRRARRRAIGAAFAVVALVSGGAAVASLPGRDGTTATASQLEQQGAALGWLMPTDDLGIPTSDVLLQEAEPPAGGELRAVEHRLWMGADRGHPLDRDVLQLDWYRSDADLDGFLADSPVIREVGEWEVRRTIADGRSVDALHPDGWGTSVRSSLGSAVIDRVLASLTVGATSVEVGWIPDGLSLASEEYPDATTSLQVWGYGDGENRQWTMEVQEGGGEYLALANAWQRPQGFIFVNGDPALIYLADDGAAIEWSPDGNVSVRVLASTRADAERVAASVQSVDPDTWTQWVRGQPQASTEFTIATTMVEPSTQASEPERPSTEVDSAPLPAERDAWQAVRGDFWWFVRSPDGEWARANPIVTNPAGSCSLDPSFDADGALTGWSTDGCGGASYAADGTCLTGFECPLPLSYETEGVRVDEQTGRVVFEQ
jgi:hypothetical protein